MTACFPLYPVDALRFLPQCSDGSVIYLLTFLSYIYLFLMCFMYKTNLSFCWISKCSRAIPLPKLRDVVGVLFLLAGLCVDADGRSQSPTRPHRRPGRLARRIGITRWLVHGSAVGGTSQTHQGVLRKFSHVARRVSIEGDPYSNPLFLFLFPTDFSALYFTIREFDFFSGEVIFLRKLKS